MSGTVSFCSAEYRGSFLSGLVWTAGLRCALVDDVHYVEWVIHCLDDLSRLRSQSWSSRSQSRNRAGEMTELRWGPAVAVVCPSGTRLTGLIMKQRWLQSWSSPIWRRRRGRLRQGNTFFSLELYLCAWLVFSCHYITMIVVKHAIFDFN